jgi:hypothetical protein
VNLRRLILLTAAAALAIAPAAHAATTSVSFDFMEGTGATVELDYAPHHTRFDLTRGGVLIANSTTAELSAGALYAGDVVTVYDGATVVATATYDGLPTIGESACIGRSSFGAQRGKAAVVTAAGAYNYEFGEVDSFFTSEETALVSVKRPLMAGDVAYAQTYANDGATAIHSLRRKQVKLCGDAGPSTQIVPPPPGPVPPPAPPVELVPTGAEMAQMMRGSLSAAGSSLRTRTTRRLAKANSVTLPFAFPEPGKVELQLVIGKLVVATAAKSSAVNGKAFLTLPVSAQGRKRFKQTKKKLKVTITAAFTPARTGAETSRASSTVTLKR